MDTVRDVEHTCSTVSVGGATGRRENPLRNLRPISAKELRVGSKYLMYQHNVIPHVVTDIEYLEMEGFMRVARCRTDNHVLAERSVFYKDNIVGWTSDALQGYSRSFATTRTEVYQCDNQ